MAACLLHPHLFCYDINIKTLIDIVIYDEDHLLITCKSFIKRFSLREKKQVNSWITKSWAPFTSAAVRLSKTEDLLAVLDSSYLCQWSSTTKEIEKHKKRFSSAIKTLISCAEFTYVVYCCGFIEKTSTAWKRRRNPKKLIIKENENIMQAQIYEEKMEAALIAKGTDGNITLYKLKVDSEEDPYKCVLNLDNFELTGLSLCLSGNLYTCWSDGNLYYMNVHENVLPKSPGSLKGKLTSLEVTKKIKILELSEHHIVLQGMDTKQEGGIVLLWDTKFGVAVSSKPLKMYRNPPLAWNVGSGVVVGDGGSLIYIPVQLAESTVASMFGSRISDNDGSYEDCVGWETAAEMGKGMRKIIPVNVTQTVFSNMSSELADTVKKFCKGSASEEVTVNLVFDDLIESQDLKLISESLSTFEFIPERALVSVLNFLINLPDQKLLNQTYDSDIFVVSFTDEEKRLDESDFVVVNGSQTDADNEHKIEPFSPFSTTKSNAINEVLVKPFNSNELSKALRYLDFKSSFLLLEHLYYILYGEAKFIEQPKVKVPTIAKTSIWLSLLIDANYHQLVLTSEAEIQRTLLQCHRDVESLHKYMEKFYTIHMLLQRVLSSNTKQPTSHANLPYSIENLLFP